MFMATPYDIIYYLYERLDRLLLFKKAILLADLCCLDYHVSCRGPLLIAFASCLLTFEQFGLGMLEEDVLEIGAQKFDVAESDVRACAELIRQMELGQGSEVKSESMIYYN